AFKIADTITVLDQGDVLLTGTVDAVRHADKERIQDLLNRRPREIQVDADAYLRRLTEEQAAEVTKQEKETEPRRTRRKAKRITGRIGVWGRFGIDLTFDAWPRGGHNTLALF